MTIERTGQIAELELVRQLLHLARASPSAARSPSSVRLQVTTPVAGYQLAAGNYETAVAVTAGHYAALRPVSRAWAMEIRGADAISAVVTSQRCLLAQQTLNCRRNEFC
jgi:hypothetical protein